MTLTVTMSERRMRHVTLELELQRDAILDTIVNLESRMVDTGEEMRQVHLHFFSLSCWKCVQISAGTKAAGRVNVVKRHQETHEGWTAYP